MYMSTFFSILATAGSVRAQVAVKKRIECPSELPVPVASQVADFLDYILNAIRGWVTIQNMHAMHNNL